MTKPSSQELEYYKAEFIRELCEMDVADPNSADTITVDIHKVTVALNALLNNVYDSDEMSREMARVSISELVEDLEKARKDLDEARRTALKPNIAPLSEIIEAMGRVAHAAHIIADDVDEDMREMSKENLARLNDSLDALDEFPELDDGYLRAGYGRVLEHARIELAKMSVHRKEGRSDPIAWRVISSTDKGPWIDGVPNSAQRSNAWANHNKLEFAYPTEITFAMPEMLVRAQLAPCPLCQRPATRAGEALYCSVGCPERECGIRVSMVGGYEVVDAAWNRMAGATRTSDQDAASGH